MFFPYKDDNPLSRTPVVTLGLIAINLFVHLYQTMMSPERAALFIRAAGAIPLEITTLTDIIRFPDHPEALVPVPFTLFTAMFVHGGWMHLISNMWFLWIFGDNVEDLAGPIRFLLFYLLTGVISFGVQVAALPTSVIPTVGASGAIAGVLAAYALRFPRAHVHCLIVVIIFITTIRVPALLVLGSWFAVQLFQGFAVSATRSGVAWFAHIGGFIAGLALTFVFIPRRRRPSHRRHHFE